jgi:hypothetical protein
MMQSDAKWRHPALGKSGFKNNGIQALCGNRNGMRGSN